MGLGCLSKAGYNSTAGGESACSLTVRVSVGVPGSPALGAADGGRSCPWGRRRAAHPPPEAGAARVPRAAGRAQSSLAPPSRSLSDRRVVGGGVTGSPGWCGLRGPEGRVLPGKAVGQPLGLMLTTSGGLPLPGLPCSGRRASQSRSEKGELCLLFKGCVINKAETR